MRNLLSKLLQRADMETQKRFERLEARRGNLIATLAFMLIGGGLGGKAMFYPYALVAFILSFQIRAQDPVLQIMGLILYVVIGIVQGIWVGTACGAAATFRAQSKRQTAGILCCLACLPYLPVLIWFYRESTEGTGMLLLLLFLCGLPLLWSALLVYVGARLLGNS